MPRLPEDEGARKMIERIRAQVEAELTSLGPVPAAVEPLLKLGAAPRTFGGLISADFATRRAMRVGEHLHDARAGSIKRARRVGLTALASIPLLFMGSSLVRNQKGEPIARVTPQGLVF